MAVSSQGVQRRWEALLAIALSITWHGGEARTAQCTISSTSSHVSPCGSTHIPTHLPGAPHTGPPPPRHHSCTPGAQRWLTALARLLQAPVSRHTWHANNHGKPLVASKCDAVVHHFLCCNACSTRPPQADAKLAQLQEQTMRWQLLHVPQPASPATWHSLCHPPTHPPTHPP
jgi:hypothetical protein